jgi:hypothetical protein
METTIDLKEYLVEVPSVAPVEEIFVASRWHKYTPPTKESVGRSLSGRISHLQAIQTEIGLPLNS